VNLVALADRITSTARYETPGDLAAILEPRTVATAALAVLDRALVDAADGKAARLIFTMPPQEGKSQRVSRWFPLWLLLRNPDLRIAIVSYADALARRWGRAIRNEISAHPELGLRVRQDTAAAHEWQLDGYDGGVITAGIGAGLTGRPVDVLIIDDPVKGYAEADSEVYRETAKDWWRGTGSARLAEGAPVVLVMTRWHEDDLAGFLLGAENDDRAAWRLINIPAQAEDGDDLLGRAPGEYLVSARGRSTAGWEARKRDAGSRAWNALFQGRPAPAEGGIFKRAWWRYAEQDRVIHRDDGTCDAPGSPMISVDATFKDSKASDFVVMQVWTKVEARAILLDQVRGRMDFPTTCATLVRLAAKWPRASAKVIEDKANGPAIIAQLGRTVPGIVAFTPKDSKEARANAIAAFVEAGNVELPNAKWAPWVHDFVEECAAFPNGTHDDQVDTMTQALHRLMLGGEPQVRWI
jgi:predicted phage terminase large subunit-like protein